MAFSNLIGNLNLQATIKGAAVSTNYAKIVASVISPTTVRSNISALITVPITTSFRIPAVVDTISKATHVYQKNPRQVQISIDGSLASTNKSTFSPYEELTGVNKLRPEIILCLDFVPLFDDIVSTSFKDVNDAINLLCINTNQLNDAGLFINIQSKLIKLKFESINQLISRLKHDSKDFSDLLLNKESEINTKINSLQNYVSTLSKLVDSFDEFFEHSMYVGINHHALTIDELINSYFSNEFKKTWYVFDRTLTHIQTLDEISKTFTIDHRNGVALLLKGIDLNFYNSLLKFGYSSDNIKNYSNTKVFLQSLYETKLLLGGVSSHMLGLDEHKYINDADPIQINVHSINSSNENGERLQTFDYGLFDITTIFRDELLNLVSSQIPQAVNTITNTFNDIESSLSTFGVITKISYMTMFIFTEYAYSHAILDDGFQQILKGYHNYSVKYDRSNRRMLDNIFGYVGKTIFDKVITSDAPTPYSSVAQTNKIVNNRDVVVMNLENDYIDFSNNTYTPGSIYYTNELIKLINRGTSNTNQFNVEVLEDLKKQSVNLSTSISSVMQNMKILTPFILGANTATSNNPDEVFMGSPQILFSNMIFRILENSGNRKPTTDVFKDETTGFINKMSKDKTLKSYFFIYMYLWAKKDNFNDINADVRKSLIDAMLKQIGNIALKRNDNLSPAGIQLVSDNPVTSDDINVEIITRILNNPTSSYVFTSLKSVFVNYINLFNKNATYKNSVEYTAFSYMHIPVMYMLIFELMLQIYNVFVVSSYMQKILYGEQAGTLFYRYGGVDVNNQSAIDEIMNRLNFEVVLRIMATAPILEHADRLKTSVDNIQNAINANSTVSLLNKLKSVMDDKMIAMLFDKQQVMLMLSSIANMRKQIAINSNEDFVVYDRTLTSESFNASLLYYMTQLPSLTSFNYKIFSVGIPQGFSNRLRNIIKKSKKGDISFSEKQSDVVKLSVHKIDMDNNDIVYKPLEFIFELSRFILDDDANYEKLLGVKLTIDNIVNNYTTTDYNLINDVNGSANVFSDIDTNNQYDFLTTEQKKNLINNHIKSYYIENYVKLLTGVPVLEREFLMDTDVSITKNIDPIVSNTALDALTSKVLGRNIKNAAVVLNNVGIAPITNVNETEPVDTKEQITQEQFNKLSQYVATIDDLSKMKTSLSDFDVITNKILTPKLFDRIFYVVLGADDFTIDYDKTTQTPSGNDAFIKLREQGKLIFVDNEWKMAPRKKNENSFLFEKYFTTVDTVFEGTV
jgi:hypothetical protein